MKSYNECSIAILIIVLAPQDWSEATSTQCLWLGTYRSPYCSASAVYAKDPNLKNRFSRWDLVFMATTCRQWWDVSGCCWKDVACVHSLLLWPWLLLHIQDIMSCPVLVDWDEGIKNDLMSFSMRYGLFMVVHCVWRLSKYAYDGFICKRSVLNVVSLCHAAFDVEVTLHWVTTQDKQQRRSSWCVCCSPSVVTCSYFALGRV